MLFQLLSLLILFISFYNFYWKRRKLPPGPTPWPLIGNILSILSNPPGTLCHKNWRKKYGNVYTYWLGELPVISVANYQTINETFVKDGDSYAGRPELDDFYEVWKFGPHGVIFTDGDVWREQRRFALTTFRNFGFGKNIMQEKILVEVQSLLDAIRQDIDKGIVEHNIAKYLDVTVGSVINSIVFGYRLKLDENVATFYEIKETVDKIVLFFGRPDVMLLWKNMKTMGKLPYFSGLCTEMRYHKEKLFKYMNNIIDRHKSEIDFSIDVEPRDYVEAFLREQRKREKEEDYEHYFNQIQLVNMCFDLWLAGQETTAKTLAWAVVYLIHNPEVKKKITEELDREIGTNRMIDLADKNKLNYLNATINEIQRLTNLLPQNLQGVQKAPGLYWVYAKNFLRQKIIKNVKIAIDRELFVDLVLHTTLKDVTIDGHFIPKNTCILPQISVVLEDEQIFEEPLKLKPERFLNENGKLKKVDEFIPFSVGKRQCLGEGLARMELYLFLANLCNQFRFSSISEKPPSLYKECSGAVGTQPFVCALEIRNHNI